MPTSTAIYPSLSNKVVLITGAAEGIGAAAVERFCQQGSKVIFFDIAESSANSLIEHIKTLKPSHPEFPVSIPQFYHCDVTDLTTLKSRAEAVLAEHGRVDVLINNAASAGAKARVSSTKVTLSTWEFDINVNLRHVFFLTQYIVPVMQKQGSGSIINMGSISWKIPVTGSPVYTAAKAAIMGLTKTWSKEFGREGIRVNSVMPGSVATARQLKEVLTPEQRAQVFAAQSFERDLEPMEIANVMLFLASDDSSAVTGSSYVADAGWVSDP